MPRSALGEFCIHLSTACAAAHFSAQASQAAETRSVTADLGAAVSEGEADADLNLSLTLAGVAGYTTYTLLSNPHETSTLTMQGLAFTGQRNLGPLSGGELAAGIGSSFILYPGSDNSIFRVAPYLQWSVAKSAQHSTTVALTYEHDLAKGLGPDYRAVSLKLDLSRKLGPVLADGTLLVKHRRTEGLSDADNDFTVDASLTYPFNAKTGVKLEAKLSDGLTEVELPTQVLRLEERNLSVTLSLPLTRTLNGRPATISPYAKYEYSDVQGLAADRSAEFGLTFEVTF